jgi:hypothetical protein
MLVLWWQPFFTSPWKVFDFFIVVSSLLALTPAIDFPNEVPPRPHSYYADSPMLGKCPPLHSGIIFLLSLLLLNAAGLQVARSMRVFRVFGSVQVHLLAHMFLRSVVGGWS